MWATVAQLAPANPKSHWHRPWEHTPLPEHSRPPVPTGHARGATVGDAEFAGDSDGDRPGVEEGEEEMT